MRSRLSLSATCALLCLVTLQARADDKANAILAAAKAASGGAAWDRVAGHIDTVTVSAGGMAGTAQDAIDGKTGAYWLEYRLGPDSGQQGFDGSTVWSVDASGQPRVEAGGDARAGAIDSAYRNSLAFWYPDRHAGSITYAGEKTDAGAPYDVVRIVPQGGRPFDFWIDHKTHLITRMAEQQETDLHTEYYTDFRPVDGVLLPFATRASIGDPKYDQIILTRTVSLTAAPDAAKFHIPAPPPPDFTFAPGVTQVAIPFDLLNNHIYLPVSINGHTTRFVFDTGATNVIGKESQAALHVTDEGKLPGGGVGEAKADVGLARVQTVQIGGLTLRNQLFATIGDAEWQRVEGAASAGLIGYEVAKRVPITIDYAHSQIVFHKPGSFKPPAGASAVPFIFNEHLPQIDGAIDGIPGKFDIDTGSRATIDVPSPFVEKHALLGKYTTTPAVVTGWGVGGPARSRLARAGEITLGSVAVPHPLIEFSAQTKGAFASPYLAGNLGGGILKRFTLGLDYAHQTLYLAKNAAFDAPYVFDRSGLWLIMNPAGTAATVTDVMPNSAGAKAGLAAGDTITAVDGKSVEKRTLAGVREMFKAAVGTRITLSVAGKPDVKLILADVI